MPALVARLPLLLLALFLLVVDAALLDDFEDCVKDTGAKLYKKGGNGYKDAAGRALYPSPEPNWYIDVNEGDQVAPVVKCIRKARLGLCPRSGGHSFVGQSSCKDVVLDMHKLKKVDYNSKGETVTIEIGNTLGEALYGVYDQSDGKRMFGVGLCPSVGAGGYLLGGGHNPYSGIVGLTCESIVQYDFVTLEGDTVIASKAENPELFWASCGGGGAHYAILVRATIKTHSTDIFNKNVYFRYEWSLRAAGELIHKWLDYDQDGGMTWFRLEINANTGIYGYGVCWDSGSKEDCENRLKQHDFFNVDEESRHRHIIEETDSVLDFQAFIGPAGNWGWKKPSVSVKSALVGLNFMERGTGMHRLYSSSYWKLDKKPPIAELQEMSEICSRVDADHIEFTLCQWNPWKGEQIRSEGKKHAFAHRDFQVFTELIGSVDPIDLDDGMAEVKRIEKEVKYLTNKYIGGIYVSYPEFDLHEEEYSYLYWGQSLPRLVALRDKMDPDGVFQQNQPMPKSLQCPGSLKTSGAERMRSLQINGYGKIGQRPGMKVAFLPSSGCSIEENASSGAIIEVVKAIDMNDNEVDVFEATVLSPDPFTILVQHVDGIESVGMCEVDLVAINSITCGKYRLKSNTPLSVPVTAKDVLAKDDKSCFPGTSVVEREDGKYIQMKDLSVGDRVRVSSTQFSPVFFFSHRSADDNSNEFVEIVTCDRQDNSSDGNNAQENQCIPTQEKVCRADSSVATCKTRLRRIIVTGNHYIVSSSGRLISAGSVRTGDLLRIATPDAASRAIVVQVSSATGLRGLYNPHTLTGTIVVDGIVASCYTQAVHPVIARILLAPLAALYRLAHIAPALRGMLDMARPHIKMLAGPLVV